MLNHPQPMTTRTRLLRLAWGLLLLAALLIALFSLTLALIPTWGATAAEAAAPEPGDGILAHPTVRFTNAITIAAPPAAVWPWLAQIGDTRGGFYSYTFIENQIGPMMGDASYQVVYHNADRIVPGWQAPQPGDALIQGLLKVLDVQAGEWLLADSVDPTVMGWTWVWHLYPSADGQATRLISRFLIEPPPGLENPIMGFMMNLGGFVMHQNMLTGIQLRAEGRTEPTWIESVEIVLWCIPLLTGLAAGSAFVWRRGWQFPLVIAVASVITIFVLTFVQPPLLWRVVIDLLLAAGAAWSLFGGRARQAMFTPRVVPAS